MNENVDLAFGILTVALHVSVFVLFLPLLVACSTLYVWADARASGKSVPQALIWAANSVIVPFGLLVYLAIHQRQPKTAVTPPLLSLRGLVVLGLMFLTLLIVDPFLTRLVTTEGSSMEPTLEEGDKLIGDKLSVKMYPMNRGDIVLLSDIDGDQVVKRIIGLPGETISVGGGQTRINGQAILEKYILMPPRYYLPPLRVPDDTYYVLGDNRNISVDSHFFGPVPANAIIAKVRYRFWPLSRVSIID